MRSLVAFTFSCLLAFALSCGSWLPVVAAAQAPATAARPSVVLVIMDDIGYGDIGSYGAPDVKTPNIDSLARDGVRFTDFYANAPNCTPTRAGLVTGRYQQRNALEAPLGNVNSAAGAQGLPAVGWSLPQLLKNNGYATALLGKWHLGYKPEFSPNAHGYDYFFGFKSGTTDYYQHSDMDGKPDLFENQSPITQDGYMTDLITERSTRFIEQNATRPFFLEVAYNAAHWPYQVPDHPSIAVDNGRHLQPHDDPTTTRAEYVAVMERADRGVGDILKTLNRLNLTQNTIVIFTNDNGGEWLSRNAPLFQRKNTLWEGGIRVPAIVKWPGRIPAGRVSPQVGITMDLTASILATTGSKLPEGLHLDGMNLFPILMGQSPVVERTLFWRTNGGRAQRAVRSGDWKLIIDGGSEIVFDVRKDMGERNDVTTQHLDIVRRLRALLATWEQDVNAEAKANGTAAFNGGQGQVQGRGGAGGAAPAGRGRGAAPAPRAE